MSSILNEGSPLSFQIQRRINVLRWVYQNGEYGRRNVIRGVSQHFGGSGKDHFQVIRKVQITAADCVSAVFGGNALSALRAVHRVQKRWMIPVYVMGVSPRFIPVKAKYIVKILGSDEKCYI